MPDLNVQPVDSVSDWEHVKAIRTTVFIEEQDCPPDEEWDGHDETSRHVLGWVSDAPVATARWRAVPHEEAPVAKLERFAVLPDHRGRGFGSTLVRAVLADARRAGFSTFLIHAQAHLEDWYAAFGFHSTGHRFSEVGIPHVEMILRDEAGGPEA